MPNRRRWPDFFHNQSIPAWPCPKCGSGVLQIATVKDDSDDSLLISAWDPDSDEHYKRYGDAMDAVGVLGMILRCSSCREVVVMAGTWSTTMDDEGGYVRLSHPRYFMPPLRFFDIPEECPKLIEAEVLIAFELFWCDKSSCLNHIRNAIELLLTTMKIPTKNQSKKRIWLHDRIEILRKSQPALAEHMEAVKWLGNAGSHASGATKDDAFDGFDLLEHILKEQFSPVSRLTKEINKRRGPRRHKK